MERRQGDYERWEKTAGRLAELQRELNQYLDGMSDTQRATMEQLIKSNPEIQALQRDPKTAWLFADVGASFSGGGGSGNDATSAAAAAAAANAAAQASSAQNETFNLIQNALASGVPTLHLPTIVSYLGYGNSFLPQQSTMLGTTTSSGGSNNGSGNNNNVTASSSSSSSSSSNNGSSSKSGSKKEKETFEQKYQKLIDCIGEIQRDVRPLYAGSKGAHDRLRRQIIQARHLVRDCQIEVERARDQSDLSNSKTSSSASSSLTSSATASTSAR